MMKRMQTMLFLDMRKIKSVLQCAVAALCMAAIGAGVAMASPSIVRKADARAAAAEPAPSRPVA